MAVLGQGPPAHKGYKDMAAVKELSGIVRRALRDTFHLQAEGLKASGNQAMVRAALRGIVAVGSRPVGHLHRGDAGRGEAVDEHGYAHRAAAVFGYAVRAAVKVFFPADIPLVVV